MRILLLTNEYPPHIYGGAGVHVDHLSRALVALKPWHHHLLVKHFGNAEPSVHPSLEVAGIPPFEASVGILKHAKLIDALYRNLIMTGTASQVDLIHCHTWYTYLAGVLLKKTMAIPLMITVHSLEPHRPWKRNQLAGGYDVTCWLEKIALEHADRIIAVSSAMKKDVMALYGIGSERIRVIYNGIDLRRFQKVDRSDIVASYGVDPLRPYVLFVGRITHQKGILHLVNALPRLAPGTQVLLCAGAPDTPEIGQEMAKRVEAARKHCPNPIHWVDKMVPVEHLPALYSHAAVFVCPSIYEPFGIINLEAMACGTPVVAAAVGGIPEVVVHGVTGILVPFKPRSPDDAEPLDPQKYAADLADAVNGLLKDPEMRSAMGTAARHHVNSRFGWDRIADQTLQCYLELGGSHVN